eukprot:CAMPEP_0170518934 /NCGR_PEP_ID=MMETSP0209-20121228/4515_1 /TAXON_ID=665100 ORGANISM="Litonotus pictus, Strain P1" /NCGR_SAMPLE_ID=MMETSP0209 /ASSEMBLY_ACC=CAM_ASM_000301 /LENGTH=207 /DNA_ID=CAMNT_0010804687 /DNA_START=1054 /DNA_END=1677 /DNA_ORIENTATION=+
MDPPTVIYSVENPRYITIKLNSPFTNTNDITDYSLKINDNVSTISWCGLTKTSCNYPLNVFTINPISLSGGDLLSVATNYSTSEGQSEYSNNSADLLIKSEPLKPSSIPFNGENTTKDQITIRVNELSLQETGYDEIITYNVVLIVDDLTVVSLAGGDSQPHYTDLSKEVIYTDVTPGLSYKVAYRAKNNYGWGKFSDASFIVTPSS